MQVVIIGAGGFCKQVIDVFEETGVTIRGLLDDRRTEPLLGYPVLGTLNDHELMDEDRLFCGIGNVQIRKKVFESFPDRWINCYHRDSHVSRHANIGTGNYFGPGVCVMPGAVVMNNNILDPLSVISHDCIVGSHNHLAANACLLGRVQIGDCNLIGANSTVLPDLVIGSDNILGAGAVSTKSFDRNRIMIGVPAREKS